MNNSKSCVVQNHKIDLSSRFWSSPEIRSQLSYISRLVRGIQSTIATTRSEKILWTWPRKWQAKVQPNKTKKRQRKKCQGRLPYIQKRNKYRQSRCYTFSAFAWTFHFFQFCHQRGKRCNLFSFSSKGFGNLKKDV